MADLYKFYYFTFKDSNGDYIKLRDKMITAIKVIYRIKNSSTDFAECYDYNIDETGNDGNGLLWVRLPYGNTLETSICINVGPLRSVQTSVYTLDTTSVEGLTVEALPVPLNSLQGYSPRLDADGQWLQYDDEKQTFTGTGIYATNTTGGTFPIVDYPESGCMSAITSNAVWNIQNTINQQVTNINNNVTNLQEHKISVKVNDTTTEEDENGLIDLGQLAEEGYNSGNTRMVTANAETIGTVTAPRGSFVSTTAYGEDEKVIALSSPHYFHSLTCSEDAWYKLFNLSHTSKIDVNMTVYSSIFAGTIWIQKNGYTYNAVTTSQYLADNIKVYQSGVMAFLVIKGNSHVSPSLTFECYNNILWLGYTGSVEESQFKDMSVFMTDYTDTDWANITASPYSVSASELSILNYNVVGLNNVDFTFADEVNYPLTLRFVATEDDTVVTISDSSTTWTSSSSAMTKGQMGVFQFVTSDNYSWSYTVQKDYESVTNKVQEINSTNSASTTNYASLYALTKWTEEHGGGGSSLSSVTINGSAYTPTNNDINLGGHYINGSQSSNYVDKLNYYWIVSDSNNALIHEVTLSGLYYSNTYKVTPLSVETTADRTALDSVSFYGFNLPIVSSVTINGSAHTISDHNIDLGTVTGGSGSIKLDVGEEEYEPEDGVITTPDYAKGISAISWLSATTSLHLSHINGNTENVAITPHDVHDKFDNAGYVLTIPSTEGVDKAICMCNFGNTDGRYYKVHIEYLGQGVDVEMRNIGTTPSIIANGELPAYKNGSSHSVYIKVNSTADTIAYVWMEDTTKANDMTIYIGESSMQSLLMGRTREYTATGTNQIRDWSDDYVKTNVGGTYILDSTAKTLTLTDTDGVEQTLNLSTITFTV